MKDYNDNEIKDVSILLPEDGYEEDDRGGENEKEAEDYSQMSDDEFFKSMWGFLKDVNDVHGSFGKNPSEKEQIIEVPDDGDGLYDGENEAPEEDLIIKQDQKDRDEEKEAEKKKTKHIKTNSLAYYIAMENEYKYAKKIDPNAEMPEELKGFRETMKAPLMNNTGEKTGVKIVSDPRRDQVIKEAQEAEKRKDAASKELEAAKAKHSKYRIRDLSRLELKRNQDQIAALVELLDSKDHWWRGSSPNFRALMKELKTLKELSADLAAQRADHTEITDPAKQKEKEKQMKAAMGRYQRQIDLVGHAAETYLINKVGKINSDYAQARFDTITDIRNIMLVNRDSLKNAYLENDAVNTERRIKNRKQMEKSNAQRQKIYDWQQNIYHKCSYSTDLCGVRSSYMGDNFTQDSLVKLGGKFSVARGAGFSLSMMILMGEKDEKGNRKYSIDDVLDPTKLLAEKQKIFKEVIGHMKKGDEDNEWLAEKFYEAHKTGEAAIDELMKKVDFKDPDYMMSEAFTKAGVIGHSMMDVWQELARIPEESLKVLKEKEPNLRGINNINDYGELLGARRGYIDVMNEMQSKLASHLKKQEGNGGVGVDEQMALTSAYSLNILKGHLTSIAEKNKDKPFNHWFKVQDAVFGKELEKDAADYFSALPIPGGTFFDYNLSSFLDGSAFKDLHHKRKEDGEISGSLQGDFNINAMADDHSVITLTDAELYRRIDNKLEHYDELKKTSNKQLQEYINGAMKATGFLAKHIVSPEKMNEDEKKQAAESMEAIFKCQVAIELQGAGATGDLLKKEVDDITVKLPEYQRYMKNIGKTSMAALIYGNLANEVSSSKETDLSKGRIARARLADGKQKSDHNFAVFYATAFACAVYEANNGVLPINPYKPFDKRFKMGEYIDHVYDSFFGSPAGKAKLEELKANPHQIPMIMDNKDKLREMVKSQDEKLLAQRAEQRKLDEEKFRKQREESKKNQAALKKTKV
ncbi:MAG: hypothetical protein K6E84_00430 [Lachnospiraceae bacterium]|nr:hypothetical protein [Lachnospiraceae bacterium]